MIQDLISHEFGKFYSVKYIAELLKNMGFSYQKAKFVSDHLDEKLWKKIKQTHIHLHYFPE